MKHFFSGLFNPPVYEQDETTLKARIVYFSLLVCVPASLTILLLGFDTNSSALTGLLLFVFVLSVIALVFFKKFPLSLIALGLCSSLWVVMTYNLFDGAALHDQGVAAFPILILFTGFLFDWKWAVFLATVMSVLSLIE